METPRKVILVASATSADRAIAIERLLASAAARSGWGARLDIRVGGIDGGAGHVSDAGLAALRAVGIDAQGGLCPDLQRRPELVEGAEIVVCDRGAAADALIDWDEAAEAEFVVVSEIDGRPAGEDGDDESDVPIAEEVRDYADRIDEVLRRTIAGVLTD